MKIPVFVSCPSTLNNKQATFRRLIMKQLEVLNLEPRSLGRTDYPRQLPLHEVLMIAKHCSGGVILGFSVFETLSGVWQKGTKDARVANGVARFPTPWNHLEAGILFGLNLPLLIFRDKGITGGVFDIGVTDVFIHEIPTGSTYKNHAKGIKDIFLKWYTEVSNHYSEAPKAESRGIK